jgi:hypothetical protein
MEEKKEVKKYIRTKCIHGKFKYNCRVCAPSLFCEHGKRKCQCKDCGGISICEHKKRKQYCKDCNDAIKVTITKMIGHSKENDKKHNRFDPVNFIDKPFLQNLIRNCEDKCYYCKKALQYKIRNDSLATIERLNNSIGHTKTNCAIACFGCNCRHQ